MPKDISGKEKSNILRWDRDPQVAANALYSAQNLCEVDSSHKYFISKRTNKYYSEAHHLIPIKFQFKFKYSLDVESNVISLCSVCHKKLHYGRIEDIEDELKVLYKNRKDRLSKCKIDISFDELIECYK
ncbi:HNH endonuclease [Gottschalkia purinilytica]|nr:HNH endonuclease [Gottschalkia purinilytica]